MHLCSRYLPRPSTSSPLDNRAHPMANTSQAPDLEGFHCEIHDNHFQNHSTGQERKQHRSPSAPRRERNSSSSEFESSSNTPRVEGEEIRRGRSPRRNDQTRRWNMSASQKIRDMDARLDAINKGFNHGYDGLCEAVYQAILEVEDPSDEVVIMAMMEGLRPSPLFDSLFKNMPETLSTLQNNANKYIAAEELAEAKCRRQGKDDHKRKELDTRRSEYRDEARSKRTDRDSKWTNKRRPCTAPHRLEWILPLLNAPIAQVLTKIKHEEFVKWPKKFKTDPEREIRTSILSSTETTGIIQKTAFN
ncbi:hypothetical protein Acr_05g0009150 [Actinidia rufa]|uniref:Uncharacterized protein n=1 Tax=Actinidia rufa TaxID=165716 RepID=A0A7J0EM81_9ERIC|nr:hypothetical protein Acr_05g0009150 [Actinidia rufa]